MKRNLLRRIAIVFTGDPSTDEDHDGIPDLFNHAVTGIGQPFANPQFDFSGPGVTMRVTRNLTAG